MLKQHNQVLISLLRIVDMLLALGSWELAYQLRFFWINVPPASMIPSHDAYILASGVAAVMTAVLFSMSHVYRPYNISRLRYEMLHLLRGQFGLLVGLTAFAFFYRDFSYSRVHLVYFMACFFVALLLSRLIVRLILHWLHKRGTHVENVVVIGGGEVAFTFIKRLQLYESSGILFKGLVSLEGDLGEEIPDGVCCLGTPQKLSQIILEQGIDQVFIALPSEKQNVLPELKQILSEEWVDVKIIPDLGSFRTLHTEVESFEEIPVITIVQSPMTGWSRIMKRLLDLTGALVALVLFAPVMALLSILIKITSAGPILYHQERMGLDGETFKTLKFRSMRVDAEEKTGAVWAQQEDNRRTRLGTVLRKYNLDELPQLFNVLRGEMSLVGPRPERPVFIHQFKSKIPDYMLRHKVKAGMTGWAQVNGWRGNTSLEKRIECDLYYIERWSLFFDIKILFLTVFKGFVDPNAY